MKPTMISFDTETSGVDVFEDRVVQLAIATTDRQGNILEHWEWIIDPGIEIPSAASDVNGWTTERIQAEGRPPREAFSEAIKIFERFKHLPWIAFNAVFDISILSNEFDRNGIDSGWGNWVAQKVRVYDPLVILRNKNPYQRGGNRLTTVAKRLGLEFEEEKLHDALEDLKVTAKVAVSVRERYGPFTNSELAEMHRKWSVGMRQYLLRVGKTAEEVANLNGSWPVQTR